MIKVLCNDDSVSVIKGLGGIPLRALHNCEDYGRRPAATNSLKGHSFTREAWLQLPPGEDPETLHSCDRNYFVRKMIVGEACVCVCVC